MGRMRALSIVIGLLLCGCGASERPILVCPEALRQPPRSDEALRDSLFQLKGTYWLTDGAGQPVQLYRYKHDYVPVVESSVMPETSSTQHISSPLMFKRPKKDLVLHVAWDRKERTVPLGTATLERRGDFEVLFVK